ncbi:hypothetical protein H0O02_03840, partial [Candidatus Micrarchaeota archaeon]|nr:hypothetical protein [Candidatus Micrarchaeota archaeon]
QKSSDEKGRAVLYDIAEEEKAPAEEQQPPAEEFECTTNATCEDIEYCAMAVGAVGGNCEPVAGECGYAANHVWVVYECGSEAGCPSCSSGFDCSAHVCAATGAAPPGEEGITADEAQAALDAALAAINAAEAAGKDAGAARALYEQAQNEFAAGDYEAAKQHAEEALSMANAAQPLPEEQPEAPAAEELPAGQPSSFPWITALILLAIIGLVGIGAYWFLIRGTGKRGR